MWQVSGAHGAIDPERAVQEMLRYHQSGLTTWDLADHYGPAEDFIGDFRRRLTASGGPEASNSIQALTKWVPPPASTSRARVEEAIQRSIRRMDVAALDLLQFHWWEYSNHAYMDALKFLADLQAEGKIHHLGLTNFDTERVAEIVAAAIPVISNQVQFSLIDTRPERRMAPLCREKGIGLLVYGTLCGGLLSEKFLGQPEPNRSELRTASLQKYKQMIDAWGGWPLFQQMVTALKQIATRHSTTIATVAVRYVLDRPAVAGVIVGTRLGVSEHIPENLGVFKLRLDSEDLTAIESVQRKSRDLMELIGDCGDEYR
jgi:aryl-alcohol dehydrogenase-like predicted oxidoreductase